MFSAMHNIDKSMLAMQALLKIKRSYKDYPEQELVAWSRGLQPSAVTEQFFSRRCMHAAACTSNTKKNCLLCRASTRPRLALLARFDVERQSFQSYCNCFS